MTQEKDKKPSIAAAWTGGLYTAHPAPAKVTWKGQPDRKPSNSSIEALVHPPIPGAINVDPTQGIKSKTRRLGDRQNSPVVNVPEETHWYDCLPGCGKK